MSAIVTSATAIVDVNKALLAVLKQYLDPDASGGIDIRFDLPEIDSTQSSPTVSVFLYDVHEDLQLRQSEPARLNVASSTLRAGWVNLSCNYLITYWEAQRAGSDGDGPDSKPDNQAIQLMTLTLQALLNNRELKDIPGAWTRVIPPQENLNSLGNFWQALGNRPRLSLVFSITVPILLSNSLPQTLVKTVSSEIMQTASLDLKALNTQLWQTLCLALGEGGEQKLARVKIKSQQQAVQDADGPEINISVEISGIVDTAYQQGLAAVLKTWSEKNSAGTEINGVTVNIMALQDSGLVYV
ncbi:DUF4255 domain-containing protein [Erwinia persicina]|uniref:DUF4255 domain-containing protein n=1 Tax=Erwinia persicina TaxID=55211 RepID=A0A4U3ESU0_9GAMM|nr:DUF4255 domain-containing protein [Erwinia persicina]MBD8109124.1 DUF4255 domain-containing protein [Erwinia persicina]MBD8170098.1 DUF4255 domain-containing protein [Erwinia persicina]MBD8212248.1 DUF4255 domain-containing protein [Erwinia persicina]TKJ83643.1 DUF4255 domain-containing protein [Erwinia persicina]